MPTILANYHNEHTAFESLLEQQQTKRILMFRGASGTGKTSLISRCKKHLKTQQKTTDNNIVINLKSGAVTVAEVFARLVPYHQQQAFPCFKQALHTMQQSSVSVKQNQQHGTGNLIHIALQAASISEREERQAYLTQAWFQDAQLLPKIKFIFLDTYEKANTEVKDWISSPFLSRVADENCHLPLRIVIAGQETPDENNIEWEEACVQHELRGIHEAEHWLPVIEEMGYSVPPKLYLAGVCDALKGQPSAIRSWIQTLPRSKS